MFKLNYWTRNDVRIILKNQWKLEPQTNGLAYIKYDLDYSGNFYPENRTGRYFNINRKFILEKFVVLLRE